MTTPTPAPRIRWEDEPPGYAAIAGGFAGPADWNWRAFIIWQPGSSPDPRYSADPRHILTSNMPGQGLGQRLGTPDELKAEAEHWLEEFVSSLGAIFPAPAFEFPDDEGEPLEVKYAPGRRVRYVHPDYGYPGEQEPAAELLVFGASYTIDWADIGQSKTQLKLRGISGELFNSVLFEPADDKGAGQ